MTTARIMNFTLRSWHFCRIATLMFVLLALSLVCSAQSFTVLHNFSGGVDGGFPYAGLTVDASGGLYGTAMNGGVSNGCSGCGTVYKLSHRGSGWVLTTLYTFRGSTDGSFPQSRAVFGLNGALYGTTEAGGLAGAGTVFQLQPRSSICPSVACEWTKTVLHNFAGSPDGSGPSPGDLAFDSAGNIFGATTSGGASDPTCANDSPCGTVYMMSKSLNTWTETVMYSFVGGLDGAFPNGFTLDSTGDAGFGTTSFRGQNTLGTVFVMFSDGRGGFASETLYSFSGGLDGGSPLGNAIPDGSHGYFGTTSFGGSGNGGTVWHLTNSGTGWVLTNLASFTYSGQLGSTSPGSAAVLTMDSAGNLYGTTVLSGAFGQGSVFKLTHSSGGWTLTTLHDFTGGADGGQPWGQVSLDSNGNIYGTASIGGSTVGSCVDGLGCGVVWQITQ